VSVGMEDLVRTGSHLFLLVLPLHSTALVCSSEHWEGHPLWAVRPRGYPIPIHVFAVRALAGIVYCLTTWV